MCVVGDSPQALAEWYCIIVGIVCTTGMDAAVAVFLLVLIALF